VLWLQRFGINANDTQCRERPCSSGFLSESRSKILSRDEGGDLESDVSTMIIHNTLSFTAPVELAKTKILLLPGAPPTSSSKNAEEVDYS
jgi:hypothetical protein